MRVMSSYASRAACIRMIRTDHLDLEVSLNDNIHDALGSPGCACCDWAAGVQKQFGTLGVLSPFSGGRFRNVQHLAFRKAQQ